MLPRSRLRGRRITHLQRNPTKGPVLAIIFMLPRGNIKTCRHLRKGTNRPGTDRPVSFTCSCPSKSRLPGSQSQLCPPAVQDYFAENGHRSWDIWGSFPSARGLPSLLAGLGLHPEMAASGPRIVSSGIRAWRRRNNCRSSRSSTVDGEADSWGRDQVFCRLQPRYALRQ